MVCFFCTFLFKPCMKEGLRWSGHILMATQSTKLSQVASRCCMDVENKCAMFHCTLCLGQVRKCVVDIQVLISPPFWCWSCSCV